MKNKSIFVLFSYYTDEKERIYTLVDAYESKDAAETEKDNLNKKEEKFGSTLRYTVHEKTIK